MMALVVGVVRVIEAKEGEGVRWIVATEEEVVRLTEVQEEARLRCLSLVAEEQVEMMQEVMAVLAKMFPKEF